ncbi:unnamed protein product [Brassica rapa subsp. narinosa]
MEFTLRDIKYAKLGNYKELQVSNAFDSSLVLLNPDIKEAQALKNMQVHLIIILYYF